MPVLSVYLTMLNEKIRKVILGYYYNLWEKEPTAQSSCEQLAEDLGITTELLGANVLFLLDEGLIKGTQSLGYPERGLYRISNLGIKALEHPEQYVDKIQFLQLFMGNVTNSTIMQAHEIKVENGFYKVFKLMDDLNVSEDIKKAVKDVEVETKKKNVDYNRVKELLQKIKADERVFDILSPVISDLLKKWFLG